jgi:hypothetical protein
MFRIYFRIQVTPIYPLRDVPNSSKQELKLYFKIDHDRFLPYFLQFIIHDHSYFDVTQPTQLKSAQVYLLLMVFSLYTLLTRVMGIKLHSLKSHCSTRWITVPLLVRGVSEFIGASASSNCLQTIKLTEM